MHVRPTGASATTSAGPSFAAGWGFSERLSAGMGFNVAYGVQMLGEREPFGRFDVVLRYTHARRSWTTHPYAELLWGENDFGNDTLTDMTDDQISWRLGIERRLTRRSALDIGISPSWGTLTNGGGYFGSPVTRSQRFTSVAVHAMMTFRPWPRKRRG